MSDDDDDLDRVVSLIRSPDLYDENTERMGEMLRDLIARVYRGEIASIACACVLDNGDPFLSFKAPNANQMLQAVGAVEVLRHQMVNQFRVEYDPGGLGKSG